MEKARLSENDSRAFWCQLLVPPGGTLECGGHHRFGWGRVLSQNADSLKKGTEFTRFL